jgi:hypothetical protein
MESGIDFSKYSSFQITNHEHGFALGANPINKQRIERAVIKELVSMGYDEKDNADLELAWFVKVNSKEQVSVYRDYYGRWNSSERVDIYQYKQGTLVIDLIDKKTNEVVWHASATDKVYDEMPDVEQKINEAVRDIFKKYRKDIQFKKREGIAHR